MSQTEDPIRAELQQFFELAASDEGRRHKFREFYLNESVFIIAYRRYFQLYEKDRDGIRPIIPISEIMIHHP